jgi:hypothetical protein
LQDPTIPLSQHHRLQFLRLNREHEMVGSAGAASMGKK